MVWLAVGSNWALAILLAGVIILYSTGQNQLTCYCAGFEDGVHLEKATLHKLAGRIVLYSLFDDLNHLAGLTIAEDVVLVGRLGSGQAWNHDEDLLEIGETAEPEANASQAKLNPVVSEGLGLDTIVSVAVFTVVVVRGKVEIGKSDADSVHTL